MFFWGRKNRGVEEGFTVKFEGYQEVIICGTKQHQKKSCKVKKKKNGHGASVVHMKIEK